MALANSAFIAPSFSALRRSRIAHSDIPPLYLTAHSDLLTHSEILPSYSRIRSVVVHSTPNGPNAVGSTFLKSEQGADYDPTPIVMIDQDSDSDATIVQLSFGDRLGALIDTMRALKDLGLDVSKGTVATEGSVKQTKIYIKRLDNGRKVEDPDMLEMIRLTVINNLLKYHPESSRQLAMGEAFGIEAPEKKLDVDVATRIHVKEDGPKKSLLYIETADRPGLLVEIIKIIADVNIDVESAEIDTEGLVAKDKFHVSYRGAALPSSLSQVLWFPYWHDKVSQFPFNFLMKFLNV
ncbi:ACT domain-containing protein ACR12 isoform X1 [Cannabis sativa]|uniref:ACT domain-containing protein ACR12 isoform X1 n=1 Tax=Cannabis sativa TaxID=3483 RepID=UPI0029C9D0D4|nr:ACT domain-containing protein ACR12 isoform X1 [Cannabis sativa]